MWVSLAWLGLVACICHVTAQRRHSTCSTRSYRRLSTKLQNEHHCLIMEQIQRELLLDEESGIRRHKDAVRLISQLDYKLDQVLFAIDDQYENFGDEWLEAVQDKIARERAEAGQTDPATCLAMDNTFVPNADYRPLARDCDELMTRGSTVNGVYPLKMPNNHTILAYCDQETDGGGWTVIQRRSDGSTNFTRGWTEYRNGFGNQNSEYWLGNEYVHQLTASKNYSLRVDLWDWEGNTAHAQYLNFMVANETFKYLLKVDQFQGDAGDALMYHHSSPFSTPDRDNDAWFGSCAKRDHAGWWYRDCAFASLNNQYYNNSHPEGPNSLIDGILWYHWKNDYSYSLKAVEMKIRPIYMNP